MATERVLTMYGLFEAWTNDLITSQLHEFSAHTRNELAMLRQFVRPGDCVLDIGAHIGTFAVPFARFVGETGRVVAFEASPDNFALLRTNVALNECGGRIEVHHGVVTGRREPCVMRLMQPGNSGMVAFEPARDGETGQVGIHVDEWLAGRPDLPPFDLVKIDVEGAELDVLRCCERQLAAHRPALYIEINVPALAAFGASSPAIDEFLRSRGYRMFRNVGDRNSTHDRFRIAACGSLEEGGGFFDVLALHPTDARCAEAERLAAAPN